MDIYTSVMDEASEKKAQPPLVDRILQCGKQAFDPGISWEMRKTNVLAFSALLERFVASSYSEAIY